MYTIYGTPFCKWCKEAKKLAEQKQLPFTFKDISEPTNDLQILKDRLSSLGSTLETIPVIFHNNVLIGGYDDFENYLNQHKDK